MITGVRNMIVILSVNDQFRLDKSLAWRVLWEGITEKGKA